MTDHWWDDANCANFERPDEYFPRPTEIPSPEALNLCAACPVRAECYEDAERLGDLYGIRGGYTEPQRHNLRQGKPPGPPYISTGGRGPAECGTAGGANAHRRRKELLCKECRLAEQRASRERRARRAKDEQRRAEAARRADLEAIVARAFPPKPQRNYKLNEIAFRARNGAA